MRRKFVAVIFCRVFAALCAGALCSPVYAQEEAQTTVLGLYMQWQEAGAPEAVVETFYDRESEQLVVVLNADARLLGEQLQKQVADPERLCIQYQVTVEASEPDDGSVRIRGALVLLAGYLGTMGAFVLILFLRSRTRKEREMEMGVKHGERGNQFAQPGWYEAQIPDLSGNVRQQEDQKNREH